MEEFSNELIRKCCALHESIARELKNAAAIINSERPGNERKRRIKPTLISSYGLVTTNNNGKGLGDASDPIIQSRPLPSPNSKKECSLPQRKKLLWEEWRWSKLFTLGDATSAVISPSPVMSLSSFDDISCFLKILRHVQSLLECPSDIGMQAAIDDEMVGLLKSVAQLISRYRLLFGSLLSSQEDRLLENHAYRLSLSPFVENALERLSVKGNQLKPSRSGNSSDSFSDSNIDAIPIAYDERRDSRNTADSQLLHANQQKLRDALLNWIRSLSSSSSTPNPNPYSHSSSNGKWGNHFSLPPAVKGAWEVAKMVSAGNHRWFSEILLYQYEQLEKSHQSTRQQKLEARLTRPPSSPSPNSKDNPILSFVEIVNSHPINVVLQDVIMGKVDGIISSILREEEEHLHTAAVEERETALSLSQAKSSNNRRMRITEEVLRMCSMAKLLAECSLKCNCERGNRSGTAGKALLKTLSDPLEDYLSELLRMAWRGHFLTVVLPWILIWMEGTRNPFIRICLCYIRSNLKYNNDDSIGGDRVASLAAAECFLQLLLKDYPPSESVPDGWDTGTVTEESDVELLNLDEALLIDMERVCLLLFPAEMKVILNEVAAVAKPLLPEPRLVSLNPTSTSTAAAPSTPTGAARKVRPVTESASDVDVAMQRRLRQWFWWQHTAFKEFSDALLAYLITSSTLLIDLDDRTAVAKYLWRVIPPLLPPSLVSVPEVVIALLVEHLDDLQKKAL